MNRVVDRSSFTADDEIVTCEDCGASHLIEEEMIEPEIVEAELVPVVQTGLPEALDELKKWWDSRRKEYMNKDSRGRFHPPIESRADGARITLGMALAIVGFFVGGFARNYAISIVSLFAFPLIFCLPAVMRQQKQEDKREAYKKLKIEYMKRRDEIVRHYTGK